MEFRRGQKVRIVLPDDKEAQRETKKMSNWTYQMNDTVGKTGIITSITVKLKYLVSFGPELDDYNQGGWYYHFSALKKAGCEHNKRYK